MAPPQPAPKGNYGRVTVTAKLDLLSLEGRVAVAKKYNDVTGQALPTFESLRQRSGFVLYETELPISEGLTFYIYLFNNTKAIYYTN